MIQCETCPEVEREERGCRRFGNTFVAYPRRIDAHSNDVPGEPGFDTRDWALFCQATLDEALLPLQRAVYTVLASQRDGGIQSLSRRPLGHLSRRFGRLWRFAAGAWERFLNQVRTAELEAIK